MWWNAQMACGNHSTHGEVDALAQGGGILFQGGQTDVLRMILYSGYGGFLGAHSGGQLLLGQSGLLAGSNIPLNPPSKGDF